MNKKLTSMVLLALAFSGCATEGGGGLSEREGGALLGGVEPCRGRR